MAIEIIRRILLQLGLIGRGETEAGLTTMKAKADSLSTTFSGTRTQLLFMAFGMMAAGGMMSRVGRRLGEVNRNMVDSFAKVEYQAVVVSTILGVVGDETDSVRLKMLQLGRDTEWTAAQAGEAMQQLAMAGLSLNQTMGAAEATLSLATIGMMEVSEAANITVGILKGFNMEAEKVVHMSQNVAGITGQLAFAATHSATTVDQLGESLKFAAAAAESAGWEFEEVTAALMTGADNMVRAGIAGRALRMSLINLQKLAASTTATFTSGADVVNQYNLELTNQDGTVKSLADTVDELRFKLDGLTTAERNAAIAAMFGARSLTLWSVLLKDGSSALREKELSLRAVAAKEAIYIATKREGTEVLKKWRKQVESAEIDVNDLAIQLVSMGYSIEAADDIIKTITADTEKWNEIIEEVQLSSAIVEERLRTLHGTQILLKSSTEALYAALAEGLVPLFVEFNRLMRIIADTISTWHPAIRATIAILVLFGWLLFTIGGKLLLTTGSIMMMAAALRVLKEQMAKTNAEAAKAITMQTLLKEGFIEVSLTARMAAASVARFTFSLVMLIGLFMGLAIGLAFFKRGMDEGNHAMVAAGAALSVLTAAMIVFRLATWLARIEVVKSTAAKITDAAVAGILAAKLHILAAATFLAGKAQFFYNMAMILSPAFAFVGVLAAIATGLPILAGALAFVTVMTWAWNASLYANPLVWILALVMGVIAALTALAVKMGWFANWFKGSGSHSSWLDDIAFGADAARRSILSMGDAMKGARGRPGRFSAFPERAGIGAGGGSMTVGGARTFAPSIVIDMGGVKIEGPMKEEQLRRIVTEASDEALIKWNRDFEAEAEE